LNSWASFVKVRRGPEERKKVPSPSLLLQRKPRVEELPEEEASF